MIDVGSTDRPRLSVCIACYNQSHFLDDAIDSIEAQRFPGCEIILVDDGSTDRTSDWGLRLGLRYIRQDNAGLSAARNTGLHLARGEYVTFLDADDVYLPGAFSAAVGMLDASRDCAFVYGGYRIVDSTLAGVHDVHPDRYEDDYAALLKRNHIAMHATVFYRRQILVDAGGFDTTLPACEDYELYLRLVRARKIVTYAKLAAGYRRHETNTTRNAALMLRSALAVMKRNKKYADLRPDWMSAYRQGIRFWKDFYGEQLAGEVINAALRGSSFSWRSLWTGLSCDWRFPKRLLSQLVRRSKFLSRPQNQP
ncbi:MAG: glycosyltransferase [Burkholderiales bacterium]|nr:glycosyltransferase [Burkholderiales bacterium]